MKITPPALLLLVACHSAYGIELRTGQDSLEFHGYMRAGLGMSADGKTQTKFQAPGARAKYRLGNEPETNIELTLQYHHPVENASANAHVQGVIMLDGFKAHGESTKFTVDNLAQGYLSFNHLLGEGVNLWLGRRYYDRKSIHIMNHYWLNPGQNAQAGVGIEGIILGPGKLNLAAFRAEDMLDANDAKKTLNTSTLDVRYHSLNLNEATTLTLWGQLALRSANAAAALASETGTGVGFWADYQNARIKDTLALIHQTGAALTQGDFNPNAVREGAEWRLGAASALEINNTLTYEALPGLSWQWAIVYRQEDHGLAAGASDITWLSTGVRPIVYITDHLNLALEAGVDFIDDEIHRRRGTLTKETLALQIAAGRGLMKRPVLRLFVTAAQWGEDFRGLIGTAPGDSPYGNDTSGWTVGAQTEAWW